MMNILKLFYKYMSFKCCIIFNIWLIKYYVGHFSFFQISHPTIINQCKWNWTGFVIRAVS